MALPKHILFSQNILHSSLFRKTSLMKNQVSACSIIKDVHPKSVFIFNAHKLARQMVFAVSTKISCHLSECVGSISSKRETVQKKGNICVPAQEENEKIRAMGVAVVSGRMGTSSIQVTTGCPHLCSHTPDHTHTGHTYR